MENVVIDAAEQSRIFNIDAPGTGADDFDVTLAGLTLQSGRTFDALERGGAIRSFATGTLTLEESTVHGNRTEAFRAGGGGIRAAGDLVLKRSTVSGNSTLGEFSRGGGIDVLGNVTLTQSTVSGNTTEGMSTDGAGIRATGAVTVTQSTVTGNQARAANATGGGIWNNNDPIVVINSILAGNTAAGGNAELRPGSGTLTVNYSLIGDTSDLSVANLDAINAGAGNLLDIDPLLDVLSDNGGPTETHALLAGSPAINAGDPSRVFDANEYDQRGATFFRVRDGRIDIGPFESGEMEPGASADFDGDSHIDGADFLAWQRGLGLPAAGKTDGDADNDNDVDVDDLKIWKQQFGQLDPPATISTVAAIPATASSLSGSLAVTTVPGDVALLRRAWHAAADQHAWPSDVEPFVPAETSLLSANFFVGRIEPPQRPTSPQNLPESLAVQAVDQFFSSKGSAEAVFASEADNWEVFE